MSELVRLGGVRSLVGGVDPSDKPEDPAVDGRPSPASFLTTDFFRGAPSGQVHYQPLSGNHFMGPRQEFARLVGHAYSACSLVLSRRTVRAL